MSPSNSTKAEIWIYDESFCCYARYPWENVLYPWRNARYPWNALYCGDENEPHEKELIGP
jgi:hypothetical protein